jgi:hypothetical protein
METNPRRHWLQFSIRALLLITVIAAAFSSGWVAHREFAQKEARRQAEDMNAFLAEQSRREAQMKSRDAQIRAEIAASWKRHSRNSDMPKPSAEEQPAPAGYPSTGIEADDPILHPAPQKRPQAERSREHKRAVEVARAYLENQSGEPIDAEFTVTSTEGGYRVFVQYVGRDPQGHPLHIPGGHCLILISKEWEVIRVLPGA